MNFENGSQGRIARLFLVILATFPAGQLLAQAEDDAVVEEITVMGYRGSLSKALDLKRDATNVRDSIVAEDIGKFPDLNIAEAIQRVPGVAISREGGEGRNITLRGFSPEFTQTTLNGMQVPAGSDGLDSGGVTVNQGRAFDFHVFASELFNRLDIQKSSTASIEEGGIAGTVDMQTAKPFDYEGFNASVSVQAGYNDVTEENDPRVALLLSNTFADGKFGALVSFAYSERTVRQEGYGSVRWTTPYVQGDSWADTNPIVNGTPAGDCPATDPLDCLWTPRLPRADFFGNDQERIGVTGSLQYRASDRVLITLDALHSELDNTRQNYNSMEWLLTHGDPGNFTGQTPLEFTLDSTGQVLVAASFDDVTSWYESRLQNSTSKFDQFVLSGEFLLSDKLTLDAMAGIASNDADRQELRYYYRSVPHFYAYDYSNGNVAAVDYGTYDMTDPNNFVDVVNGANRDHDVNKENFTTKFDFSYDEDTYTIKYGVAFSDREVDYAEGNGTHTPFDPSQYTAPFPYSGFGAGLDGPALVPFLVADFAAIQAAGLFTDGYTPNLAAAWNVTEQTLGAYLEFNTDFDVGTMLLRTNFGLRYVDTTVISKALVGGTNVEVERDYDNFLPSMNLALEVTEDLVTRLAYGRTMTRPSLNSLNIAGPNFGYTTQTVSNLGDPGLNPYESNDVDLGIEWYFGEESLLGLNLFYKDIVTSLTTENVLKFVDTEYWPAIYADPQYIATAPLGDPAVFQYTHSIPVNSSEGYAVKGYELIYQQPFSFFEGWLSGFGIVANYTHVSADDSTGLSPESYNFTLYYEQDRFGGRISMNSRDDYLLSAPGGNGHVEERKYGPTHVDFSSYYDFTDNLTFTLEIINLTDEVERIYGTGYGNLDLTREYSHTGTQWFLGARYSF